MQSEKIYRLDKNDSNIDFKLRDISAPSTNNFPPWGKLLPQVDWRRLVSVTGKMVKQVENKFDGFRSSNNRPATKG